MLSARDLDKQVLADLLLAGAEGIFVVEAATRLIVKYEYWLHHDGWLEYVLLRGDPPVTAVVDWKPLMEALDSGFIKAPAEESQILRIAASLIIPYRIYLREQVEGIDRQNIKLVAEAIMYADGFLESVADPRE